MKNKYKKLLIYIKDYMVHTICPTKCSLCGEYTEIYEYICPDCKNKLKYIRYIGGARIPQYVDNVIAAFYYEMGVENAIKTFKFNYNFTAAFFLSEYMAKAIFNNIEDYHEYTLIPVPLYKRDERFRDYNQSFELCKMISEKTGIKVNKEWLKKIRRTRKQHKSNAKVRIRNLRNAFLADSRVLGKNIILVDDVFTTGSTAYECAKELKAKGAKKVVFLCSAVVRNVDMVRSI